MKNDWMLAGQTKFGGQSYYYFILISFKLENWVHFKIVAAFRDAKPLQSFYPIDIFH